MQRASFLIKREPKFTITLEGCYFQVHFKKKETKSQNDYK